MKIREHLIDGKSIKIYDDVFSFGEMQSIYGYAFNSLYRPMRRALNYPGVDLKYTPTLKSNLCLSDMLKFSFFQSKWVRDFLRENNLRVASAYINLCTASDTYAFHTDADGNSIPTMLAYLNMYWEPSWEGETHFSDTHGKDILYSAGFIPGRVIVFDSSIPHKSSQPGPLADTYRYVLAVKLAIKGIDYKEQSWNSSIDIQDFFFDKNVAMTSNERRAMLELVELVKNIPHSDTTFFDHLFNTFCILKGFGCDEATCLAGMFHAVYGTEYFNASIEVDEQFVQNLIGCEANDLVKLFCGPNRDAAIINNLLGVGDETHLKLLYILYANIIEQAYRINFDFSFIAAVKNKIDYLNGKNT